MNNGLLYLGGLLVVILAALFSVPFFIDWNGYRGVFEEEASKVLGRDVRVGGGVNLRLLPTPYVRFEKVRLADTTGQTGEPFVRADSFTMWLSGPALLRGVLEAKEVELTKPVLSLVFDDQGGGNWDSLKLKPGALPFVPRDVALRSVVLIDGAISLNSGKSGQISRIEAINGELSADALAGPFKFKGVAKWGGEDRDIKFATTEPDASGAYRIKANVRSLKSASNYAVDAKIEDFAGKPKFDGEVTARFAMPEFEGADKATPGKTTAKADVDSAGIEMKSKFAGNALGAKFDDINISFEDSAAPQVISGTASAAWAGELRLDTVLAAKWLDLDRLAGAGQSGASFQHIEQLGLGFMRSLAGQGAASAKIAIEQVKLAGETAGGLSIDAERKGGAVTLKELRASLPGGSRLELAGQLKDDSGTGNFDGQVLVRGANLGRLLQWAAKSGAVLDIKADGPFSIEGHLLAGDKRFDFTDASAEIGGQPLAGELKSSDEDGRRRVAIIVEGARLDTAQVFPAKAHEIENDIRMALGLSALRGGAPAEDGAATPANGPAHGHSDVSLRILAGELSTGGRVFRNVDAKLAFEAGEFRVPEAKFTAASGLGVIFGARVKNAATDPKGTLNFEFDAKSPEAMKDMAVMTGLAEVLPPGRIEALGPARVAGLIRLGDRAKGNADVTFGGNVKTAKIAGQAEFDSGLSQWRTAPSRITLTGSSPDMAPVMLALGADVPRGSAAVASRAASVSVASSGTLATGAMVVSSLKAEGLDIAYNGKSAWPETAKPALDGIVALKARDLAEVLSLAGVQAPGGLAGTAVDGTFSVTKNDDAVALSTRQLTAGATRLRGQATIKTPGKTPGTGNAEVTGEIAAGDIKVAGLLSSLLERAPAAAPQGTDEKPALSNPWPEGSFNFDAWKAVEGTLRVSFAALELEPGMTARNGSMTIGLKPGKVTISDLNADAAGGRLAVSGELEKIPAGVSVAAKVKIDGALLEVLSGQAKGRAGFDFALTGQAQSPAAVIQQLSGKGTLSLEGARHPGPLAGDVAQTSDLVLSGKMQNEPDVIRDALALSLSKSHAESGTRTIPISVVDGAVRVDPFVIEGRDGKATVTITVDLASLSVDSAWAIAAMAPPQQPPPGADPGWTPTVKGPLPPVSVVYTGKLADPGHLRVKVDSSELQRELTVRQMERNVEELERLRRKEEGRIRLEQERRKALEVQKAAAAAQAVAAQEAAKAAAQAAAQSAKNQAAAPALGQPPAPPTAGSQAPVPAASTTVAPENLPPILPDSNSTGAITGAAPSAAAKAGDGSSQYNTEAGAPDAAVGQNPGPTTGPTTGPKPIPGTVPGPAKQVEIMPDQQAGSAAEANKLVPRPAASPSPAPRPRAARGRSSAEEMTRALGAMP